jgi:hypothetical protein
VRRSASTTALRLGITFFSSSATISHSKVVVVPSFSVLRVEGMRALRSGARALRMGTS